MIDNIIQKIKKKRRYADAAYKSYELDLLKKGTVNIRIAAMGYREARETCDSILEIINKEK